MAEDDRIAIIGMNFLFPGSHTREQFWRNVHSGAISIHQFTEKELKAAGIPEAAYRSADFMAASGVLPDISGFDADFFGMSGREADLTDPQQRIFLECCYHTLEDGGYAATGKGTRVGVYASTGYSLYPFNSYLSSGIGSAARSGDWISDMQWAIGNSNDFMATRVAFRLGLTGPAMNIQAGCSSSLIAVDLASQALRSGDADLALVGASAVHVPQVVGYQRTRGSILSRDGQCRAFDADANGTVGGNGVAAVLLKRLERALLDGDTVYAVVEGCGIVNDGDRKQAYSAPSATGQRDAVLRALDKTGCTARDIGYLETHGTGTYKGDRIELEGLTSAFREHTDDSGFCALGTTKPAIGHLDACAGMAGLIKAALVLRHSEIPPLPNFRRPNPILPLDDSPFFFPTRPQAWPRTDGPQRAGVHALGIGGTNAHVILAGAPDPAPPRRSSATHKARTAPALLPLSGRTEAALRAWALAHRDHLRDAPGTDLTDLFTTAALGRRHLRHRLVVQGRSAGELAEQLDAYLSGAHEGPGLLTGVAAGDVRLPAFLFTGQGSTYAGMASTLYERFGVVRETLDEAHDTLRTSHGIPLLDSLLRSAGTDVWSTDIAQPALFALQAAMVRLWRSAGVEPGVVAGHSVGEYAALHCAGALSLADGLRLTAERGRLLQDRTEPGGMVAVLADRSAAQAVVVDVPGLELSVANGPLNHVLAGPAAAVDAACVLLDGRRVHYRRLPVARAFHTALLDPVREELARLLSAVAFRPVRVPFLSGLDGSVRPTGWLPDADYLVRQARLPVRFDLVLAAVAQQKGVAGLLEIGPDAVLARLARQVLDGRLPTAPTQQQGDEGGVFWSAVARLHCWGADVDWAALLNGCGGRRIPLPLYPFQHVRHWAEQPQAEDAEEHEGEHTMTNHVLERITELTASHLGCAVGEVAPERPFVDLGADSLQMVAILRELEQEFQVQVSMRELLEEADTPGRLSRLITTRTAPEPPVAEDTSTYASRESVDALAAQVRTLGQAMQELALMVGELHGASNGWPTTNGLVTPG
jgi:acyl carrier protein